MTDQERLINAKDLAKILALSSRGIHRLNSAGKIPRPIKIGGSIRWVASEISAWLKSGAVDRESWERVKTASES